MGLLDLGKAQRGADNGRAIGNAQLRPDLARHVFGQPLVNGREIPPLCTKSVRATGSDTTTQSR